MQNRADGGGEWEGFYTLYITITPGFFNGEFSSLSPQGLGHFGGGVVPPLPPRLVPVHLGLTAQLIDPDLIVPARGDKRLQYSGILDEVGGCMVGFVFSGRCATWQGSSSRYVQFCGFRNVTAGCIKGRSP